MKKIITIIILAYLNCFAITNEKLIYKLNTENYTADTLIFTNYKRISIYLDSIKIECINDSNIFVMDLISKKYIRYNWQFKKNEKKAIIEKIMKKNLDF